MHKNETLSETLYTYRNDLPLLMRKPIWFPVFSKISNGLSLLKEVEMNTNWIKDYFQNAFQSIDQIAHIVYGMNIILKIERSQ